MSFAADIKRLTTVYEKRMRAVAKESVQEVVKRAQLPRAKGGRMRVDTGFLRASIAAAIGHMPSGQSENLVKQTFTSDGADGIAATLIRWNPDKGETIFVGWTANYSVVREHKDGFMRGATEKWDLIVDEQAKRVKASIR